MRQPRSWYLAERRFRRQISIARANGLLLLLGGVIICLIVGEAQLAAGSLQGFLGMCFIALIWGASGIWMMRSRRRRPHWLEIAVLKEQREKSLEERSDGSPLD